MKSWRLVLPLLLGLCFWGLPASAETWALIVGISKYQNPQIASLRYPAADATSVQKTLVNPQYGQVPEDHVKLLTDDQATKANIMDAVQNFLMKGVKAGDQVVVFLAGHGVTKGVGAEAKSYLLSTDVKGLSTAALEDSAVNLKELSGELSKLPAAQFVVFVDACREDPTPGRGIKGNPLTDVAARSVQIVPQDQAKQSAVTVFACQVGQRAYEDPTLQHGVFTYWVINAIEKSAIPTKADGSVDMGTLYTYVRTHVEDWAKMASKNGSFEVEQTPEMASVNAPVVLMKVKRPITDASVPPTPPVLVISTDNGAQVLVNGNKVSTGPVAEATLKPGDNLVRVESPGSAPVQKNIQGVEGYRELLDLRPGMAQATNSKAGELYQRSLDAEAKEQWEAAMQGYQLTIQADPKYTLAYEKLAALQIYQGDLENGITTLVNLNSQATPTAHTYSLLSRAYALYVMKDMMGKAEKSDKKEDKPKKGGTKIPGGIKFPFAGTAIRPSSEGDFHAPKDRKDAIAMAQMAADEAVKLDANSSEAQIALGFALIAADSMGKNRKDAMAAFGKAVFFEPKEATAQYGTGYALRYFSMFEKDKVKSKEDLNRAVASLKEALNLRSNYYEAHRELAYCYHLLDDSVNARKEYETANANRGQAGDKDEVAGMNVAMSALWKQAGQGQVAEGYLADAKDIQPNLQGVLRILRFVGFGNGNLGNFLPGSLRDLMGKVPGIPGVHIPGFPF